MPLSSDSPTSRPSSSRTTCPPRRQTATSSSSTDKNDDDVLVFYLRRPAVASPERWTIYEHQRTRRRHEPRRRRRCSTNLREEQQYDYTRFSHNLLGLGSLSADSGGSARNNNNNNKEQLRGAMTGDRRTRRAGDEPSPLSSPFPRGSQIPCLLYFSSCTSTGRLNCRFNCRLPSSPQMEKKMDIFTQREIRMIRIGIVLPTWKRNI